MKYSSKSFYWNFTGNCKWCGKKLKEQRTAKFYCDACRPAYYHNLYNVLGGREWTRTKVRTRDSNTCQDCGKIWNNQMRRFDVHHKDFSSEKTRQVDPIASIGELVTLCHKCHCLRHKNHRSHLVKNLEPTK